MNDKKEDQEDQEDHVMFSSSWAGNIAIITAVVLILAAAFAYKEFF